MHHPHTGTGTLLVTLFVFPGVRLLDVTGPIEVFSSANEFGGRYRLNIVSADGTEVTTAAGTRLSVDMPVADLRETSDVLVIPGGPDWERMIKDDALLDIVRRLDANSRRTASICTGALLLAAAGLLDGRRAATHWRQSRQLAQRFPAVRVDPDAIFVQDGKMMTSAGVSAGIDLSLALVEEHCGAGVARAVAKDMVVFMQRPGGQSQFSVRARVPHTRQEMLRRALDAVAEDPGADHSLAAMARRAGISPRHVARLFCDEVGTTPARYVEQIRLEAAQAMLETGDDPMAVIARRTGFGSPESLRRAFVRNLMVTPGAFRARFHSTGFADTDAAVAARSGPRPQG
ncbi:transcriptional regulator, AraC family with amidase-like domain [Streptomyces sp. DvalAA-14]|uniref:GlxA family transcriptional regulator n=1 Tax=unclassified Streptomyces TaxID=2593676 RepID=UPI00081B6B35|nr:MULTISPECIES: DJ-1/PfpI family protein [unclassified Streptomyces]MYS23333.1 helix-turn-helix domain-containing protein [Streptomyces sp. SID4948]SCE31823.1 transcriptional regulator, AraC family with amidase-like domain [Streptomyces sp. DvalAA-14]